MDAEMIAYLDKHFGGLQQRMDQQGEALRKEMAQQGSTLREEMAQQVAALRGEMIQRFDQMDDKVHQTHILLEDLHHKLQITAEGYIGLNEKLDRYHNESTVAIDQVRGWIEPCYRILDGRLRVMESRAERQDGDVFEAIQRILGRPPLQQT